MKQKVIKFPSSCIYPATTEATSHVFLNYSRPRKAHCCQDPTAFSDRSWCPLVVEKQIKCEYKSIKIYACSRSTQREDDFYMQVHLQ